MLGERTPARCGSSEERIDGLVAWRVVEACPGRLRNAPGLGASWRCDSRPRSIEPRCAGLKRGLRGARNAGELLCEAGARQLVDQKLKLTPAATPLKVRLWTGSPDLNS
jgi:hypothetical protein